MAEKEPTVGRGISVGDRTVTAVTIQSDIGLRSARRASVALVPGTIRGGRINHVDALARAFEQVCELVGSPTDVTWVGILPPNAVVQSFDLSDIGPAPADGSPRARSPCG